MSKPNAILTAALFCLFLGGFFVLGRVMTPPDISAAERRPLEKMPELSLSALADGSFTGNFESYAADSFPGREGFRALKAAGVLYLFGQSDKAGLYWDPDVGAGKFERLDETSARQVGQKIRRLADGLTGLNLYYSVVPDKSAYARNAYPGIEPDAAQALLAEELGGLTYIDLADTLSAECYYRTDLHWSQDKIRGVAQALTAATGVPAWEGTFAETTAGTFFGAYPGQLALPTEPDWLKYLTGEATDALEVQFLDEKTLQWKPGKLYDPDALGAVDPYNFFLGGPQPLITIDNPNAATQRELYLFRDSFGSSLAPLLALQYARVTLIDLRYLDSRILPEFVEFRPGSDALFLYGSQILNQSTVLLVG